MKINWDQLSQNPNAIRPLKANEKINWDFSEPTGIRSLEANLDEIDWEQLFMNPSIFTYDYSRIKAN